MRDETGADTGRGRIAPAAERNKAAILEVLREILPAHGSVLEIASGTGQHAAFFASELSGLEWQPTDTDPAALESMRAHAAASGCPNIAAPALLDTRSNRWPVSRADAVLCVNMIHIAAWEATEGLFRGSARVLPAGAPLILYGPFRLGGRHTAPSNAAFDDNLRRQNPEWGVRDLDDVAATAREHGFVLDADVPMPANNRVVVFVRADGHSNADASMGSA